MKLQHVKIVPNPRTNSFDIVTERYGFALGPRLWKGGAKPWPELEHKFLPLEEAQANAAKFDAFLGAQTPEKKAKK